MATPATKPAAQQNAAYSHPHPDNAAIAEESAAIYPDTNEGRPTPDEIAAEAYRIYMGRGATDGQDMEDWLEAERRLSAERR
jgi:Protein of unknown function (DUF2934)